MGTIEVVGTGIVYRNPLPHLHSRHAFFPTAAELPSGEVFVAFDLGSAFEAIDVRSVCSRSCDGGESWSEPVAILLPDERTHIVSTTCRVGQVRPGELLAWGCLFDRSRPDLGLLNPETRGFCRTDFVTQRSLDGGRTWSRPLSVSLPVDWPSFETCAPPFSIGEDRLLVVTSAWPDWSGRESPWRHDGLAFASRDGGETWGELVQVVRQDHPSLGAFEQALTRLSDGRVLAICWNYDIAQSRSLSNRIAFSNDGFAFGACRDAPLKGETCRVLGLPSNRVLAVYRRVDRPGLWAQLARIDGDQWIPKADLQLWTGSPSYGDAADLDGGVAKMSSLRFGCPTVVHLSNGEAFVAFWCFEDCISVIRWFRLAIQAE